MTREEAVEYGIRWKNAICDRGDTENSEAVQFLNMAIEALEQEPSAQPFTEEQIQTMQELESAQIEKAYELGKADRPKWIPCSERLPEIEGKYLVTFCAYEKEIKGETVVIGDKNKSVAEVGFGCSQKDFLGYPIGFGWYDLGTADYYDKESIAAWMPLPEAYREDGEEE